MQSTRPLWSTPVDSATPLTIILVNEIGAPLAASRVVAAVAAPSQMAAGGARERNIPIMAGARWASSGYAPWSPKSFPEYAVFR